MVRLKNYLKFFRLKQTEYGKYFYICDVVMYGLETYKLYKQGLELE